MITTITPPFIRSAPSSAPPVDPPVGDTLLVRDHSALDSFTSGRLGFYIDYSELATTGTHNFAITRRVGTSGAVGCTYTVYDDDGTTVLSTGTLSWADGNADIKIVSQVVSSKNNGTHRIRCQLSAATGGAALHFGSAHTVGYAVIDDNTVASDAISVFFDTAAGSNGSGTAASPYDNIYDAISNVGSKRYIYGSGTVTPDGTDTSNPYGQSNFHTIDAPASRSGEDTRVYIESWPGQTPLTIGGAGGTNKSGFFNSGTASYHTYRKVNFTDLDSTGVTGGGAPAFGIWYHYGTSEGINVELCDFDGINGSENNGGVNYYGTHGGRVWRCTMDNISKDGSFTNQNTAGVFSYLGSYISIQRSEFNANMSNGTYQKRTLDEDISFNLAFNIFRDSKGYYGQSGGGNPGHNGIVCSNNLFTGTSAQFHHSAISTRRLSAENEISNNYFFNCGESVEGGVSNRGAVDLLVFNNIFDSCKYVYTDEAGFNDDLPVLLDWNLHNDTESNYASIDFSAYTAATFASTFSLSNSNSQTGIADATNPAVDDVTLGGSSNATGNAMGAYDMGIYMTGIEIIGVTGLVVYS